MQGRGADTIRAAREFAETASPEMIKQMPDMETAPSRRSSRWCASAAGTRCCASPLRPASGPTHRGVWHYARGLAFNAKGQPAEARRELTELEAVLASVSPDRTLAFFFRTKNMLQLAANVLAGEIAAAGADTATAARLLRAAVAEQDTHWFTEPPPWYFPVRQALGAILIQAGRAREAEQVYRDDLARNPDNGWSLFGLAQSLRAQGKIAEAEQADASFKKAWSRADVTLTASRF